MKSGVNCNVAVVQEIEISMTFAVSQVGIVRWITKRDERQMSYTIHPRMTAARRAWLERLRDDGPAERGKSRTGFDCMQLGWTEWDYRVDGKPITADEAREQSRAGMINYTILKERITEAGLRALDGRITQ